MHDQKTRSPLAFAAFTLALAAAFALPALAHADTAVVDPAIQFQTFQGWGTSLAWWAKVVGDYPEPARTEYMEKAFDPVKGLGLNVVRYNIGGGEKAEYLAPNKQYLEFRAVIPGFEPSPGKWDWSADAGQRWVLKTAMKMGANQVEAFSNSPPWWMTVSGSVTGNHGGQDNLKPDSDPIFADYLAVVAKHFETDWGVRFRDIEPLNEPDGRWWTFGNHQEGCFVERPHQNTLVKATGEALARHGVHAAVSASDANTIGDADQTAPFYDAAALRFLNKINTHSYGGGDRTWLSNFAITHGKDLWLSEYGDGDASGMQMSRTILADMNFLHPSAWVYWQVVDSAGGWGFLKNPQTDETNTAYTINKKYYVMGNYSKFVRPGYRLVAIGDPQSIAAVDAKSHTLVIVTTNGADTPWPTTYDLSRFTRVGPEATPYRTSPSEDLARLPALPIAGGKFTTSLPPKSVTTFVLRAVYTGPMGIDYRANYTLESGGSGLFVAVSGTKPPRMSASPSTIDRNWGLIGVGDGYYKIVNRASGTLIHVPQALRQSGQPLLQHEDNGGTNQQWRLVRAPGGAVTFVNRNSGLALTDAQGIVGAVLTQETDTGAPGQSWRLTVVK